MIRSVSMNIEKAFFLWKLELIRTKERIFEIRKTQLLNNMATLIHRKMLNHKRIAVTALAEGVTLTKN